MIIMSLKISFNRPVETASSFFLTGHYFFRRFIIPVGIATAGLKLSGLNYRVIGCAARE